MPFCYFFSPLHRQQGQQLCYCHYPGENWLNTQKYFVFKPNSLRSNESLDYYWNCHDMWATDKNTTQEYDNPALVSLRGLLELLYTKQKSGANISLWPTTSLLWTQQSLNGAQKFSKKCILCTKSCLQSEAKELLLHYFQNFSHQQTTLPFQFSIIPEQLVHSWMMMARMIMIAILVMLMVMMLVIERL